MKLPFILLGLVFGVTLIEGAPPEGSESPTKAVAECILKGMCRLEHYNI